MDLLFGRRKTPEELLRQNQRALNRAMRELDRERQKLETQEKKIIADIKKMAKQGQMDAVRIMAKDLVRTRRYVRKFVLMRANIQAVSLKIQTLKSNNSMAQAMKGVTKAMGTMNRQLKLPQIQKIMMEFERQAEIMDMKEEMMNDAIDDAMGDEDDEEESDAVVAQVLDELGLSLTDELSSECLHLGACVNPVTQPPPSPCITPFCMGALPNPHSLQTSLPLEAPSVWLPVERKQRLQPLPWWTQTQTWRRGSRTFEGTDCLCFRREPVDGMAFSLYLL
ncbi:charged multivesicular body protein 2a isoform X1 [Ovis aries]|uniref:charged multivesicular body protein 2a isoform X1 n=1 Tax=Ovis aries TaxID=9940 RepID=UPI00295274D2|nr:charged multivesicular body protein 2a isoform X1 [Ovis aries]